MQYELPLEALILSSYFSEILLGHAQNLLLKDQGNPSFFTNWPLDKEMH